MATLPKFAGRRRDRGQPRPVVRLTRYWSRLLGDERAMLALLALAVAAIGALAVAVGPGTVPPVSVVLPLLAGGLVLRRRALGRLLVVVAGSLAYDMVRLGLAEVRVGALVTVLGTSFFAGELSRGHERLGMSGPRTESMLLDLRDQLRTQGELPALPAGWGIDVVLRSAGGAQFGGDFLVSGLNAEPRRLELALVDVSGKGLDAGTRALLLSGALGGLLGAVPPAQFLAAANSYLLRQDWAEGFATAAHLAVNLETGEYLLESAGHPPAAHFSAGSGRWRLADVSGTALGLLDEVSYVAEGGTLRPGDALLLYTDGMVEIPGRDLSVGIDKLLGEAEHLVPRGFAGGAQRLVAAVAPAAPDDRALVLLWRS